MKKYLYILFKFSLIFALFFIKTSIAQSELFIEKELSRDSVLKAAQLIIDSARCKVLITVDDKGKPHARAMAPFPVEADYRIWLGTYSLSRKVKQIKNNPNVVVYYFDSGSRSYVSINGTARLVNDADKKEKYWLDGWKIFYPDREKDYILIEVTPERLEVCSFKYKLFWNEQGVPASVEFISDIKGE